MYAMKYALCRDGGNVQGCAKNKSSCEFRTDHNMSVYTSANLTSSSWEWQADLLPNSIPTAVYFRGKVLRNRASAQYVLWIFGGDSLIVATATSPVGPFALNSVRKSNEVLLHKTGDFSFMIEADDAGGNGGTVGTAYIIYNADMKGICIEQLAPDYLSSLGVSNPALYSSGVIGAPQTEAPTLFERNGLYYALFDHLCCVCSYGSGVQVHTAAAPLGPYVYRGQVGRSATGVPTTHAQQCWVMQLPAGSTPEYVWIGDRWGSAPDSLHGHDLTYWQPLRFSENGSVAEFEWLDSFEIELGA